MAFDSEPGKPSAVATSKDTRRSVTRARLLGLALVVSGATLGPANALALSGGSAPVGVQACTPAPFFNGRGINLPGWLTYSSFPGRPHSAAAQDQLLDKIRRMGFAFVRLPVDPRPLLPSDPSAAAHFVELEAVLDRIGSAGLGVVLDMHPVNDADRRNWMVEGPPFDSYRMLIEQVARRLSRRAVDSVALEVINEPSAPAGHPFWKWAPVANRLVQSVRRASPRLTVVVDADQWAGVDALSRMAPICDPHIVYSVHFYEPFILTHEGANWGANVGMPQYFARDLPYPFESAAFAHALSLSLAQARTPADSALVRRGLDQFEDQHWTSVLIDKRLAAIHDFAKTHNVSVYLGEFGALRMAADEPSRCRWIRDVRTSAEKYGISWSYFELAGNFGLLNANGEPDVCTASALGLTVAQPSVQ